MDLAIANEEFRCQRLGVVVRTHHRTVGTRTLDDEPISQLGFGKRPRADKTAFFLGKNVTRLAQRPAHNHLAHRSGWRSIAMTNRHRVVRTVENRPRQIIEAGIHKVEPIIAHPFNCTNLGHQKTGLGDQISARFNFQVDFSAELFLQSVTGRIPKIEIGR